MEDHFDRSFELEHRLEESGKHEQLAEVRAIAALATMNYVRQGEPLGLGHAVSMARDHVGNEAFVVMLPDDIMHEKSGILAGMLAAHERYGASVLALKKVAPEEIAQYGSVAAEAVEESLVRVHDLVEKPRPEEAPSNLAVMGRYVLTPAIFDAIDRTTPGALGEIQLTDAIKALLSTEPVYGFTFSEGRFDVGNKLDYLKATFELALERDDIGPPLRAFLQERLRSS
jgi:UTP--glucose-1-phosphate uridylyltransferase